MGLPITDGTQALGNMLSALEPRQPAPHGRLKRPIHQPTNSFTFTLTDLIVLGLGFTQFNLLIG